MGSYYMYFKIETPYWALPQRSIHACNVFISCVIYNISAIMNTSAPLLRASEVPNFGPSLQGHWAKGSPNGRGAYARAVWAYANAIWGCPVVLELPDAHNLKSCLCNSQDLWSVRLMPANCSYPMWLPYVRDNDELWSAQFMAAVYSYHM